MMETFAISHIYNISRRTYPIISKNLKRALVQHGHAIPTSEHVN